MSQELLFTFGDDLREVALCPGLKGGYDVYLDDDLIWSRSQEGRFPEAKELKQLIRDRIDPERDLGHSDR
jgi:selenoprotein W-related protein